MRADDDVFAFEFRVIAFDHSDDVVGRSRTARDFHRQVDRYFTQLVRGVRPIIFGLFHRVELRGVGQAEPFRGGLPRDDGDRDSRLAGGLVVAQFRQSLIVEFLGAGDDDERRRAVIFGGDRFQARIGVAPELPMRVVDVGGACKDECDFAYDVNVRVIVVLQLRGDTTMTYAAAS